MNTASKLIDMTFTAVSQSGFVSDVLRDTAEGFCKDEPLADAFVRLEKASRELTGERRMTLTKYEDEERPLRPLFQMAIQMEKMT